MSNENLSEGKLPSDFQKSDKKKLLGIILEETNNINSEFDNSNSKLPSKENVEVLFSNHTVNFKNLSYFKETEIDNDIKYKTYNSFLNKNTKKNLYEDNYSSYNIMNDEKNEKNLLNNKENKHKSEDIIILNSGKKQNGLIKLISKNNSDNLGKDNYTKNINLNININNNIQYEIEKNKEKEDENNELNQSFNSLLKIAEKNCLYFSETLPTDINNNKNENNNKDKEKKKETKKLKENNKLIKVKTDKKETNNLKEKINLTLNSKLHFRKISNQKIKKLLKREENQANNNINTKNLIPSKTNLNNKGQIYNKKKSIPKNISNKNNRNLSFKLKEKEESIKIYKRIKKSKNNVLSIGKIKEIKKKIEGENNDEVQNIENRNNNRIFGYKKSTYNIDNNMHQTYSRNTFNDINSNIFNISKSIMNKKFFEVDMSLDNCYQKLNHLESNVEDGINNIYRRPTMFINPIKKIRNLEKLEYQKDPYNHNTSRQKEKNKINKGVFRTRTNTSFQIGKNEINKFSTYIKKNPKNPKNNSINNINIPNTINFKKPMYLYGLNKNQNNYFDRRSRNDGIHKERNILNNFHKSEFNLKKYKDIYNNTHTKNFSQNNKFNYSNKLGDLLILEEKLCDVILGLKNNKKAENQSLDFFNYFFNFSMYKQIEKIFDNDVDEEIVRLSLNYKLISVLLCYKFSKNKEIIDISQFIDILQICHRNLINIYEQILDVIQNNNEIKNIWVEKLCEIIDYSKRSSEQIFHSENFIPTLIGKINFNTNSLIKKIKNIIYNTKYQNNTIIINFIKNLNQKTYEEIFSFFKNYIYIIDNTEGSILPQIYRPIHPEMHYQSYPYIKSINNKKYTLILDLNETLISLKYANQSKGLIRVRPFLYEFLDAVKPYYEIIIFTGSTENYTKSIVEALERKKKYFDFVFYRQYLVKCGDCYLKDLSKIGRPLDSTIIIDNNPQNYKLQKENGIFIKSFWGENNEDMALCYLNEILIKIAKTNKDVRDGIAMFKDEIIAKVSANIS